MPKMFYTYPLAAVHMSISFGVKFLAQNFYNMPVVERAKDYWQLGDFLRGGYDGNVYMDDEQTLYVHPESLHIFEPKVGDIVRLGDEPNPEIGWVSSIRKNPFDGDDIEFYSNYFKARDAKIIQRDGKPFFWPLSEE